MASRSNRPDFNRRKLLGLIGMGGAVGVAGCLGDDDDDDDDPDPGNGETPPDDPGPVDPPDEAPEVGGTVNFGMERSDVDDYDYADSSTADDSIVANAVYDGLLRVTSEGEYLNWMAREYEVVEAQDLSFPDDYTDYMEEYEITDDSGDMPVIDIEWPNTTFAGVGGSFHPDDLEDYENGDLEEGDTIRALTRTEAEDAAADGTYGVKIEGELHEGITFHNGEELTSENVVRAYDRYVGSINEGQVFDAFLHAEEDGEYGFVLYGQEPDAIAPIELPVTIPPSEHFELEPGEIEPREDDGATPIGTGPFEIAEVEEGTRLVLHRNDDYWLENIDLDEKEWWDGPPEWWDEDWGDFPASPLVEEVNVRFAPEGPARAAAMDTGELDLTYELSAQANLGFEEDPDFEVHSETSTGFKFVAFPINETDDDETGVYAHKEVRQAVSHLIPRQEIVDFIEQGYGTAARQFMPEPAAGVGSTMEFDELQNADFAWPADPDEEAAEAFLDEAPVEPPLEVEVHTNAEDEVRQDKMAIMVDALNESGLFEAVMETPADLSDWVNNTLYTEEGDQQYAEMNATATIGLAAGFDPHSYVLATHHPASYNFCCNFFYPPGTIDWIGDMDLARFSVDATESVEFRQEQYDLVQEQACDDVFTTLVDFSDEVAIAGPNLSGYAGFGDRRFFITQLHNPMEGVAAWMEDE